MNHEIHEICGNMHQMRSGHQGQDDQVSFLEYLVEDMCIQDM